MDTERLPDEKEKCDKACTVVTSQKACVSVPVTVKPKVNTGDISTFCYGEPKVTPSPYVLACKPHDSHCSFVLTQNVCIEIPVEFSADAMLSPPSIKCMHWPDKDEPCCE